MVDENNVIAEKIKLFYGKLKFPGLYTLSDLKFYDDAVTNKYLKKFDDEIKNAKNVLDVGCGSGFIVNFLARKNPDVNFDALDFSESIEFAKAFAKVNKINNVNFIKDDFLTYKFTKKYDVIICNGVIHHIPKYKEAIIKLFELSQTNGKLVIGVYNKYGKVAKKFVKVNYMTEVLRMDQECVPYEMAWTDKEFTSLLPDAKVETVMPSIKNYCVDLCNMFNYKNGGLTIYTLVNSVVEKQQMEIDNI